MVDAVGEVCLPLFSLDLRDDALLSAAKVASHVLLAISASVRPRTWLAMPSMALLFSQIHKRELSAPLGSDVIAGLVMS